MDSPSCKTGATVHCSMLVKKAGYIHLWLTPLSHRSPESSVALAESKKNVAPVLWSCARSNSLFEMEKNIWLSTLNSYVAPPKHILNNQGDPLLVSSWSDWAVEPRSPARKAEKPNGCFTDLTQMYRCDCTHTTLLSCLLYLSWLPVMS